MRLVIMFNSTVSVSLWQRYYLYTYACRTYCRCSAHCAIHPQVLRWPLKSHRNSTENNSTYPATRPVQLERSGLSSPHQSCLTLGGATVPASLRLRNLGSIMDSTMNMDAHVQSLKCAMYFHLRAIKKIRYFLDRVTCISAVISLVMSRLDYCNVLLISKSVAALRGLQVAQNYAA